MLPSTALYTNSGLQTIQFKKFSGVQERQGCSAQQLFTVGIYNLELLVDTDSAVPARPGAFNANFAPETLESFKAVCRDRGKYTKVLEQFAVLYIQTRGEVLTDVSGFSGVSKSAALIAASPPEEPMPKCWNAERVGDDRIRQCFEILILVDALEQKLGGADENEKHLQKPS